MEITRWPDSEDAVLYTWRQQLTSLGFARCVHRECGLCFLSLAGAVSHQKICLGWASDSDYISCIHCGARFKQFLSCQTHMEKSHSQLYQRQRPDVVPQPDPAVQMSPDRSSTPQLSPNPHLTIKSVNKNGKVTTQSQLVRARAPDGKILLLTPSRSPNDMRPGPQRLFPVSAPSQNQPGISQQLSGSRYATNKNRTSRSHNVSNPRCSKIQSPPGRIECLENIGNTLSEMQHAIREPPDDQSLKERELELLEKERKIQERETLVRQREREVDRIRLVNWERNLQQREEEANRRLASAQRIIQISLNDNSPVQIRNSSSIQDHIIRQSVDVSSSNQSTDQDPLVRNAYVRSPNIHSFLNSSLENHRSSTPLILLSNTVQPSPAAQHAGSRPITPIVIPSSTKLPSSAIKLSYLHPPNRHSCLNPPDINSSRLPPHDGQSLNEDFNISTEEGPINLSLPKESWSSEIDISPSKERNLTSESSTNETVEFESLADETDQRDEINLVCKPLSSLCPDISMTEGANDESITDSVVNNADDQDDIPLVDLSAASFTELLVSPLVVTESNENIEPDTLFSNYNMSTETSPVNVSVPFHGSNITTGTERFLNDPERCLETLLEKSGDHMVMLLATQGTDGKFTLQEDPDLVTQSLTEEVVQRLESELQIFQTNIEDLTTNNRSLQNKTSDEITVQGNANRVVLSGLCNESLDNLDITFHDNTDEPNNDLADYLEKQLKVLQPEINNVIQNKIKQLNKINLEHEAELGDEEEVHVDSSSFNNLNNSNKLNIDHEAERGETEEVRLDSSPANNLINPNKSNIEHEAEEGETQGTVDYSHNNLEINDSKKHIIEVGNFLKSEHKIARTKKRKRPNTGKSIFAKRNRKCKEFSMLKNYDRGRSILSQALKTTINNRASRRKIPSKRSPIKRTTRRISIRIKSKSEDKKTKIIEHLKDAIDDTNEEINPPDIAIYKCGRCLMELKSPGGWRSHQSSAHGGCARLYGDPLGQTFTLEQEIEGCKAAFKICRRVRCPKCCEVSLRSSSRLVSHLRSCGKTEKDTEDLLKKSIVHSELVPEVILTEDLLQKTDIFSEIVPEVGSEEEPHSEDLILKACVLSENVPNVISEEEHHTENMLQKTPVVSEYDPKVRSKRAAATRAKGKVAEFVTQLKRKYEDESSSSSEDDRTEDSDGNYDIEQDVGISSLYELVNKKSERLWLCLVCSTEFGDTRDIESHILSEHQEELIDDEDSWCDGETDEEYDEYLDEHYNRSNHKRRKSCNSSSLRKLQLEPSKEQSELEILYRTKCYNLNSFPELTVRPEYWEPLDISNDKDTIQITVTNLSTKKTEESHLEMLTGGQSVLYCGDSVWGLSWCPLPSDSDQCLALSCGDSQIQIWTCGTVPHLLLGLSHNYGRVRRLIWCPSGGWNEDRLGLLAAACSDGTVRIWSVPSSLPEGTFYKPKEADLTLMSGGDFDQVGECLDVSWYRGPHHRYITAGFTSGMVAVWDIGTKSPLMRQDGNVLPTQTWLAHIGSVKGVCISPGDELVPRYLLTGGSDRHFRFWDLRDTSVPLQESPRRGLVTGVSWLPSSTSATISFDDVYLQSHTQTIASDLLSGMSQPVVSQNSAVWDQSLSHWNGTLAVGTSAGELILFVFPSSDKSMEHDKNVVQRRSYLFRTVVNASDSDKSVKYLDIDLVKCPVGEIRRVRAPERMDMEDLTSDHNPLMINRVAWNNNLGSQTLLAAGGNNGIVRLFNLTTLDTRPIDSSS